MSEQKSNETRTGCFAWCVTLRKGVNKRLARIRNSLRRILARENGTEKTLTPGDLEDESGSHDIIITRVKVSPRCSSRGSIPCAVGTSGMRDDTASITSSVLSAMANEAVTKSLTDVVRDLAGDEQNSNNDDTDSLSSRALSDMADAVVTESLTRFINDTDDVKGGE